MHSSEFLKYAYELGAAQALADFEKDAGARELAEALRRHFGAGLAGARAGVESTLYHPTFQRVRSAVVSGGPGNSGSLIDMGLNAARGVVPDLVPRRAAGTVDALLSAGKIVF